MKQSLQLRLSQQLTLTPQLQQSIRLLQLSTVDMQQEVADMMIENPMLEMAEEFEQAQSVPADSPVASEPAERESTPAAETDHTPFDVPDWRSTSSGSKNYDADDDDDSFPEQAAEPETLREHLHAALQLTALDARDRTIVGILIDALDDTGYLTQDLEELLALMPQDQEITLDDLETGLIQLQHLDQPGIAARNLEESLLLQLKALPDDVPQRDLAIRLIERHIKLVASHDYRKLKKLLRCNDEQLRIAQELISSLNPRPGGLYNHATADYIIPDIIVDKHQGEWRVQLNIEAMPKLRVNQIYANILQQRSDSASAHLSAQLQEARLLIKSLHQRFETILRVAQSIVRHQADFLEHGEISMKPLVLREIADELEMHESTISRSTTQKYMLTPRGIYEFKYFFGSSLTTQNGGSCSSTAIRELIKQMVSNEDRRKPLSDSRMSELLAEQGIKVARRTIAKYREGLNIPPVNLRKSL